MLPKIVVLDGEGLNPGDLSWDSLKKLGDVAIYPQTQTEDLAISRIGNAAIVLTNKTPITASLLCACPGIRYIGELATGYNNVDCDAAKKRGIPVCNVPSYGTEAVAQFTFALLLEICHQIGLHNRLVHSGKWCESPAFCFWDTHQLELSGKTFGIIGYGRIGQATARLAAAFGMEVRVYSRTMQEGTMFLPLEELLKQSDIVSLHCPLTAETEKLINAQRLSLMKKGAILLNTSRGGLLDEAAVAQALHSGKLGYLGADVASREPIVPDNPLLTAPNCILTPHMAWAATASRQRLLDTAVENLRRFLDGHPQNIVNP